MTRCTSSLIIRSSSTADRLLASPFYPLDEINFTSVCPDLTISSSKMDFKRRALKAFRLVDCQVGAVFAGIMRSRKGAKGSKGDQQDINVYMYSLALKSLAFLASLHEVMPGASLVLEGRALHLSAFSPNGHKSDDTRVPFQRFSQRKMKS